MTPDLFVIGKAVGGGIPVGLYGVSAAVAERFWRLVPKFNPALVRQSAHLGFGGTLAGSTLQVAAVRVVLASTKAARSSAGRDSSPTTSGDSQSFEGAPLGASAVAREIKCLGQ